MRASFRETGEVNAFLKEVNFNLYLSLYLNFRNIGRCIIAKRFYSLRNQLYRDSSVKYDPLSLYDKCFIFRPSSYVKGTLKYDHSVAV